MGTEVTKKNLFGGGPIALRGADAIAKAMQNASMDGALGQAPEGSQYLNFSGKRGVYEFGADKADLDNSELWVVNVESFAAGWVCWKGGSPAATRLASIFADAQVPTPDMAEHGPFSEGEGWFRAKALVARSLDRDAQGYFKTNSKSGVAVVSDLQAEISERMTGGKAFWPVVQWDREKFQARGKTNFKPTIVIYGWLTTDAMQTLAEDEDADIDDLIQQSEEGVAAPDAATADAEEVEQEAVEVEVVETPPARQTMGEKRRAKIEAAKAATPPAATTRRARL